jgi:transposase
MEYHAQTTPTVAAESVTICIAIELSTMGWLILLSHDKAAQAKRYSLAANDAAGLLRLIERERTKLTARGFAVRVVTCFEAGRDGFWLHRFLRQHGIENFVIDPASLRVDRRARSAKTDRLDAERLLLALLALLRGETRECRVVRVPSAAEEDAKRPGRERQALIEERVRHVNRVKSLCATQGVTGYEPMLATRREKLAALRGWDGAPLPAQLTRQIERELDRIELVLAQIGELERARDAVLKQAAPPPRSAATKIRQLAQLKGVGVQSATLLTHEVFYRDFDNRRQVGGYFGLGGAPFRSGTVARDQGIAKSGNARARAAMIELSWFWLKHQPDSALSRWFHARVGAHKGRVRRIAIVALARKLAVALWHYIEHGVIPAGAARKAE